MKIRFLTEAHKDLQFWKNTSPPEYEKIKKLLRAIQQEPFNGIGKPEPLKHQLAGWWSRRITREHRLVYKVENHHLVVLSCRYHYE